VVEGLRGIRGRGRGWRGGLERVGLWGDCRELGGGGAAWRGGRLGACCPESAFLAVVD
jgi:hypothetical protein